MVQYMCNIILASRFGDSGPLWPLETQDDVDSFLKSPPPGPDKAVVMKDDVFTKYVSISYYHCGEVAHLDLQSGRMSKI